jgi:hypothetical protein
LVVVVVLVGGEIKEVPTTDPALSQWCVDAYVDMVRMMMALLAGGGGGGGGGVGGGGSGSAGGR